MYRKYLPWHISKEHLYKKDIDRFSKDLDTISLLNWNVHKKNHTYRWVSDFFEILNRYEPDIITFQEYKKVNYRSIIDHDSRYNYIFLPNISLFKRKTGLITASKFKIIDSKFKLSKGVEPVVKTPKSILLARYKISDQKVISVVNVHMINFVKISLFKEQLEQLNSLLKDIDTPIILSGDFNTWSKKRLNLLNRLCEGLGLKRVDFKRSFINLDHIYFRGLKLKEYQLLGYKSSDHKGMFVSFDIF